MMQVRCKLNAKASHKNCICIHMSVTVIVTYLERFLSSQEQESLKEDTCSATAELKLVGVMP